MKGLGLYGCGCVVALCAVYIGLLLWASYRWWRDEP